MVALYVATIASMPLDCVSWKSRASRADLGSPGSDLGSLGSDLGSFGSDPGSLGSDLGSLGSDQWS